MSNRMPYRYRISDWHQLKDCQSNNSKQLKISVSDIFNDDRLNATKIAVNHDDFGTLFACTIKVSGNLVDLDTGMYGSVFELPTDQILSELKKFGFNIIYQPYFHLDIDLVEYLISIHKLGFDKIRILPVYKLKGTGVREFTKHIVAFKIKNNSKWIQSSYASSESEFLKALSEGSVLDLSTVTKAHNWSWDWLEGYVGDIVGILNDNS